MFTRMPLPQCKMTRADAIWSVSQVKLDERNWDPVFRKVLRSLLKTSSKDKLGRFWCVEPAGCAQPLIERTRVSGHEVWSTVPVV